MICIVGLVVFGFLGIFSATYREYTLEALACIGDKATGGPCETGFDERYRAWAVENAMKVDMRLASFVKDHFQLINWVIFLLMFALMVFTVDALYNLYMYGSCDPGGGCTIQDGARWLS